MAANSKIAWTHHTFNPWWGCTKVSEACENCYAERDSKRYGHDLFGPEKKRRFFGIKHWNEPLAWNAAAGVGRERHRVFCASMADVFEDHPDLAGYRAWLWDLVARTPNLDWLILTKRPDNAISMLPMALTRNIWMGVTVETARHITRVVAWDYAGQNFLPVHFLSIEPMLDDVFAQPNHLHAKANWLIVGAESGPRRRPTKIEWVRNVVNYGRENNVPVFIKQLDINGQLSKDPQDWPEDLRVQQFPTP